MLATTCENSDSVHRLECDCGVIVVNSALYGRADSETCTEGRPPEQLTNTQCSQTGTIDIIRQSCEGKTVCEINIDCVNDADPCPGTYKYLQTNYSCVPAREGQVINVISADYGRHDETTCSYNRPDSQTSNTDCSNPTNVVALRCNGQTTCSISASNSEFGDPCQGTYKYLEVAYTCECTNMSNYMGLLWHLLHR
ncbi:L-rhamnose-binding lectin SML-like [Xenentodon cancila]